MGRDGAVGRHARRGALILVNAQSFPRRHVFIRSLRTRDSEGSAVLSDEVPRRLKGMMPGGSLSFDHSTAYTSFRERSSVWLKHTGFGMGFSPKTMTADQALNLWRLAVVEGVRRDTPDLSSRQMAVLLTVYQTPAPHTVRGLARTLGISKPAITRALDRLGKYGLLTREVDTADRRSVLVVRTPEGEAYLESYAALIIKAMEQAQALDQQRMPMSNLEVVA